MARPERTRILARVSELGGWLGGADGTLLAIDCGVVGTAVDERVTGAVRRSGCRSERVVLSHRSTLPAVRGLAERLRGHTTVVGVGGGGVIDQVKLASVLAGRPDLDRALLTSRRCGLVALPDRTRRGHRLAVVPTTVGTGAHVSPNACLEVTGVKRLYTGDVLRPDAAAVDAVGTDSLPVWLLAEGVLENVARLAGFYVGTAGDVAHPADHVVERLAGDLVRIGYTVQEHARAGRAVPAEVRAELAWLSGRTHGADLVTGRDLYLDKSWPLAHELSAGLGLRKVQAMAAVLVPLWRLVGDGESAVGSGRRLRRLWDAMRGPAPGSLPDRPWDGLARLMADWGIDTGAPARAVREQGAPAPATAERLARRACRAWGDGLPMLRGLTAADVRHLYAQCLDARCPGPPYPDARCPDPPYAGAGSPDPQRPDPQRPDQRCPDPPAGGVAAPASPAG